MAALVSDRTQIAFFSMRDGDFEVYLMSADGRYKHNLTRNPTRDGAPPGHRTGAGSSFIPTARTAETRSTS